jgi:hypothetical protein
MGFLSLGPYVALAIVAEEAEAWNTKATLPQVKYTSAYKKSIAADRGLT